MPRPCREVRRRGAVGRRRASESLVSPALHAPRVSPDGALLVGLQIAGPVVVDAVFGYSTFYVISHRHIHNSPPGLPTNKQGGEEE